TILYAVWEAKTYTVTVFYDSENETADKTISNVTTVSASDFYDDAAPTKEGYRLTGWMVEGAEMPLGAEFTEYALTADTTFTAVWTEEYTVKLEVDADKTENTFEDLTVLKGEKVTLPEVTPKNATDVFKGWSEKDVENAPIMEAGAAYEPKQSITLVALFADADSVWVVTRDFNYTDENGMPIKSTTFVVDKDADNDNKATVTLEKLGTPKRDSHTFNGWVALDADGTTETTTVVDVDNDSVDIAANTTFRAKWTINTYEVKFVGEDGTALNVEVKDTADTAVEDLTKVAHGTVIVLPIAPEDIEPASENDTWVWEVASTDPEAAPVEYEADDRYTVTSNVTFKGYWKAAPITSYTVTRDYGYTEEVEGEEVEKTDTVTVEKDENDKFVVTLEKLGTPVRADHTFKGWVMLDAEGEATETIVDDADDSVEIEADTTFKATWEEITYYSVAFKDAEGTALTLEVKDKEENVVDLAKVVENTVIVLPAAPEGSEADKENETDVWMWTVENTDPEATPEKHAAGDDYTVAGNVVFTGSWEAAKTGFTVTVKFDNGETNLELTNKTSVSASDFGTPTKTGYTLKGWKVGEATELLPVAFTNQAITENTTFTAVWEAANPSGKMNRRLDMNDIPHQDVTEEFTQNGFTLIPSSGTALKWSANSKGDYTARVQLPTGPAMDEQGTIKGAIKFEAKAGAIVAIYGISGNSKKTTTAEVSKLVDGAFVKAADFDGMPVGGNAGDFAKHEAEISADGTYYITNVGTDTAFNLYYIQVTYEDVSGFTDDVQVTVTFDANGGTPATVTQKIISGNKCLEPGIIKDGSVVDGYYKDAAFTQPFNIATDTVDADMTLYVKWKDDTNRVPLTLNVSELPAGDYNEGFVKNGYTVGANVTIAATSKVEIDGIECTKMLKTSGKSNINADTGKNENDVVFSIDKPSRLVIIAAANGDNRTLSVTNTDTNVETKIMDAERTAGKYQVVLAAAGNYRIIGTGAYNIYYLSVDSKLLAPAIAPAAGELERTAEITITNPNDATTVLNYAVNDGEFKTYDVEKLVAGDLVGEAGGSVTIKAKVTPASGSDYTESDTVTVTYTVKSVGTPVIPVKPEVPDDVDADQKIFVRFVDAEGEAVNPDEVYSYTGVKVEPKIEVYNYGKLLKSGTDYTVKYKNNIKAGDASLTVTGKGNLSGASEVITFKINPADINVVAHPTKMTVAVNSKAAPVLMHGTKKLGTKDYTLESTGLSSGKFTTVGECTLTVKGQGNYDDTTSFDIEVNVVEKAAAAANKLKVKVEKNDLTYGKFAVESISDLVVKTAAAAADGDGVTPFIKVTDKNGTVLTEDTDFVIYTPSSLSAAGTVKFTVVGMGEYSGTVNKTFKIKPSKVTENSQFTVTFDEKDYEYKASGATVDNLKVVYNAGTDATDDDDDLVEGVDYKVSYSNNKKVSGTKKAQVKITFLGDYKGSKAVSKDFTIVTAKMSQGDDGNTVVVVPDKAYGKPNKSYKSTPIVMVDGVAIKASNYKVHYSVKAESADTYTPDDKAKVSLGADDTYADVKVTLEFKANSSYAAAGDGDTPVEIEGEYKVRKPDEKSIDLSKAKVVFTEKDGTTKRKNFEYNGKPFYYADGTETDGDLNAVYVQVTVKGTPVASDLYDVTFTNATEKGKATVVVNGTGITGADGNNAIGSKNASFSIKAMNLKRYAIPNNKPVVAEAFKEVLDMIF
ncbi:MAG: InlB B-repeat-containing protein, partial [Lachnospiraceae bacterium]|nr:InlB B-repeat-containing protein [Lachnospiraceae bacterium]